MSIASRRRLIAGVAASLCADAATADARGAAIAGVGRLVAAPGAACRG
jgi:hypothetical protein